MVLALAVALGFRLVAHDAMGASAPDRAADTFAPVVDSEAYLLQALRLPAGRDIVDGVTFQAPLYPYLLGGLYRLLGVPGSAVAERTAELPAELLAEALAVGRGLNLVLGLALVLLLGLLGRRLFGPGAGLAAAFLAALSSPFVYYEGHLLKVSLSLLVLPTAVLLAARAAERERARAWLPCGLVLGLGGLVRGNMHLLAALGALALLVAGWRGARTRRGLADAAALLLGAGLAVAPVIVRNSLVAGRPVLSTAAGGTAFYLCNHAGNDTGLVEHIASNRQIPRWEADDWQLMAERALGRELSAGEVNRYWMDRARADIAADPGRWLLLELRKLGLLFSRYEAPDNTLVALGEDLVPALDLSPSRWALVAPLALAGAWLAWSTRRRRPGQRAGHWALALALLGYAASLLLFNMTARFRMPVQPLAMVYAGALLAALPGLRFESTARRAGVAGLLVAGLLLGRASEGPLGPLDAGELAGHRITRFKNRAQVALSRGDLAAARADSGAALDLARDAGLLSTDLLVFDAGLSRAAAMDARQAGDLATAEQQLGLAQQALSLALAARPDHADALWLQGLLAYDAGAHDEAAERFRAALASQPGHREARQYLALALASSGRFAELLPHAEALVAQRPDHDDGLSLLAWARWETGDAAGAREALEACDRAVSMRASAGLARRLPALPVHDTIRASAP